MGRWHRYRHFGKRHVRACLIERLNSHCENAMSKRKLTALFAGVILVILLSTFLLLTGGKVEVGMPQQQVEEIMGGPGLRLEASGNDDLRNLAKSLNVQIAP